MFECGEALTPCIDIYVHNVQISTIQVVCVSVGRVDESTSGAIGLRVNGSLDGKVDEIGKMKESFVVRCEGMQ